jgi:outer membrane protein insertion porin family
MNIDDFLFSTGGGARLTIPGLPIGLYLVKRFQFNNGQVEWQAGNTGLLGLDFVISFNTQIF